MATENSIPDDAAPVGKKKGSGSKVILVLGVIFGLCCLACCGGGVFIYYKLKDFVSISTDKEVVKADAESIVHVDYPPHLQPMSSFQMKPGILPVSMKMVMFQSDSSGQDGFVIMEMDMNQPGQDPKLVRQQMLQQMRSQQSGGGNGFNQQITAQSTVTRKFNINGEVVEFDFVAGTRSGDPTVYHQVTGTFAGKKGTVLVMYITPDAKYNEEEVIKLILSIRIPGSELPTELVEEGAATGNGQSPNSVTSNGEATNGEPSRSENEGNENQPEPREQN